MIDITASQSTAAAGQVASATPVTTLRRTRHDTAHLQARLQALSEELANSAAIVELVQRVGSADGVQSACFTIAASLKDHLRCDRVVVGMKWRGHSCRLVAVSGVADVDQQSDESRRIKAALDECLVRNELSAWPPLPARRKSPLVPQTERAGRDESVCAARSTKNNHQLLAHKQLARRDSSVMTVPLKMLDGEAVGALMIIGRRETAAMPQVAHFADAISEPLGSALALVQRVEGSRLRRLARTLFARHHTGKRRIAAAMLCAIVAVMMIPLPYKVSCRSVTEPVERRFSVAPFDGLLEGTLAEPGDLVRSGQLLARMDGREVRWELAGVAADTSRAAKKRDTHMANHETADALLAELEMKHLESRSRLLQFREQNLEISSPVAGIVLSGSLDRRENYPVTKGQVLYEVAPLDSLRVEVSVPAEDITHVQAGMDVALTFDGLGGEVFEGRLQRIRPRSEIRDAENVFIAEVVIENSGRRLRPGMQGRAKIISDHRAIGWILFHRACEKVQTMWRW